MPSCGCTTGSADAIPASAICGYSPGPITRHSPWKARCVQTFQLPDSTLIDDAEWSGLLKFAQSRLRAIPLSLVTRGPEKFGYSNSVMRPAFNADGCEGNADGFEGCACCVYGDWVGCDSALSDVAAAPVPWLANAPVAPSATSNGTSGFMHTFMLDLLRTRRTKLRRSEFDRSSMAWLFESVRR